MKLRLTAKIALSIIVLVFVIFCVLEYQSPIYLYINDTEDTWRHSVIGGTSPGVSLELSPGEKKFVDMPFWWGEPQLVSGSPKRKIEPAYNFLILKVVYISQFSI